MEHPLFLWPFVHSYVAVYQRVICNCAMMNASMDIIQQALFSSLTLRLCSGRSGAVTSQTLMMTRMLMSMRHLISRSKSKVSVVLKWVSLEVHAIFTWSLGVFWYVELDARTSPPLLVLPPEFLQMLPLNFESMCPTVLGLKPSSLGFLPIWQWLYNIIILYIYVIYVIYVCVCVSTIQIVHRIVEGSGACVPGMASG